MLQNRILDIVKLLLFVLLQVLLLNNINFLGYADPYVYILFILFLPLNRNKYLVLIYAFFAGLFIDFFEYTGGINAAVTVLIAFLRLPLIRLLQSSTNQIDQNPKLSDLSFLQWVLYLVVLVFLHHILIDFLQTLSFSQWEIILKRTAIGASLTIIICILYLGLFPKRRNQEF